MIFTTILLLNSSKKAVPPVVLMSIGISEIIMHAIIVVITIGWESNFHYYLFLIMITSFLTGRYGKIFAVLSNGSAIITYVALYFYCIEFSPFMTLSEVGTSTFAVINLIGASGSTIILTAYYNKVASVADKKYISANKLLVEQKEELSIQAETLEQAHRQISASIRYAKRIQAATLPAKSALRGLFGEENVMVLYSPKDIVSGDFYWCAQKEDKIVFAVSDCTGHGVPGAMLTMIGQGL